jgi:hypothetical protein
MNRQKNSKNEILVVVFKAMVLTDMCNIIPIEIYQILRMVFRYSNRSINFIIVYLIPRRLNVERDDNFSRIFSAFL